MKTSEIDTQYATGLSRQAIEQALVAAGKDPGHLRPADLARCLRTSTRWAASPPPNWPTWPESPAGTASSTRAAVSAEPPVTSPRSGCHVTAVDLTEEYCQTARWLNQLAGLDDRISVRQADVTDLPFEDATFTLMFSQHVQMNVADKARLYAEARRVLVGGGRLAVWDVAAGARQGRSATRCRGPTSQTAVISSRRRGCAPPSRPPGSPLTTGQT